jgi:lipopolysaccharide/colanic/teichoic acid biosynthesis glycosyltransferase
MAEPASEADLIVESAERRIWAAHPATSSLLKRGIDLAVSGLGLVALLPFLGTLAVLIKLDSPGPAVFAQERIGLDGRPFVFYKFRSMYEGSAHEVHRKYIQALIHGKPKATADPDGGGEVFKLAKDMRVTRIGRIIRRLSLDELPQLLNVLRGEMSLVGPRPAINYEVDMYKDWYKRRFAVLPGITGLWQISGRSERTFEEMIELDLKYVDNWSLLRDVEIIFRTFLVVIRRQGAC